MFNWIRNASFKLKVVLAPTCAIVCLGAVSLIGFVANNSLSGSLLGLGEVRIPKIVQAAELDQHLRTISNSVNQSLAWEGAGFKAAKIEELDQNIAQQMARYELSLQDALGAADLDDTERELLSKMNTEFTKYRKSATEALDIKTGMLGNAVFYMSTMEGSFGRLSEAVQALIGHERSLSGAAVADARALGLRNKVTIVVGLLLALAAALASAWLMASAMQADFREKNLALVQAYKAIEEASLTDALTGLRNRRFLDQQLDADISLCVRRYKQWLKDPSQPMPAEADLVFFIVDIDHFKVLNDTHGHSVGDEVLSQMRQRLQEACRESDYLVRWGGEEFLVVARGTRRADAESIAERIRTAVNGRAFDAQGTGGLSKSCSVGFACFPFLPSHPDLLSWAQVVELADQALYMAKHGGRDAWVGLSGSERTQYDDVRRWLARSPRESAHEAGLQVAQSVRA
jgi:diguanylate cyclase (GGDEF)-like protein